jgi:hypothetical protein
MLSSLLAEAKGDKAPAQKATPKVKSAVAQQRETTKSASTAFPALRVEKRAVAKGPAPIAKALNPRTSIPAKYIPRSEKAAPCDSLPVQATIARDTIRPVVSVDERIADLLAPHPLAVKQAATREKAAQEAAAQQASRQRQRGALGHRQPAAPRVERYGAQQREILRLPKLYVPKEERRPKRLSKYSYEQMSQRQLLDEAQFRGFELDFDYKGYLVEVLVLNDEAYVDLMQKLGDPIEAVEFARGEVKQHNKELRQQRVAAKAKAERTERERAEAHAAAQQAEREARETKRQEERVKAKQLALERRNAEKKAQEMKQAAEAQKQEQTRKRSDSQNNDSGYSSKYTTSPGSDQSSGMASAKGKKRVRSNDDDVEDKAPDKKAKSSKPLQSSKAPRPVKPVKKTTKETTRVDAPTVVPLQASTRQTRRILIVEDSVNESMEDTREGSDEDTEDDEDDFVVDDGYESKPKRKSKLSARDKKRLFAGF